MALPQKPNTGEKEHVHSSAEQKKEQGLSPDQLGSSRGEIAGTLIEGMEGSERASEQVSEGREVKGDSTQKKKTQKGDDKRTRASQGTFTFDEKNLPPADEMITRIERELRTEIKNLEKRARYYQGGMFRKADFPKYSETMIEIRKKHVLLRRIFHMAAEALKKLFIHMFGKSGETSGL